MLKNGMMGLFAALILLWSAENAGRAEIQTPRGEGQPADHRFSGFYVFLKRIISIL